MRSDGTGGRGIKTGYNPFLSQDKGPNGARKVQKDGEKGGPSICQEGPGKVAQSFAEENSGIFPRLEELPQHDRSQERRLVLKLVFKVASPSLSHLQEAAYPCRASRCHHLSCHHLSAQFYKTTYLSQILSVFPWQEEYSMSLFSFPFSLSHELAGNLI